MVDFRPRSSPSGPLSTGDSAEPPRTWHQPRSIGAAPPMSDHERRSQDPDDPRASADVITPPDGYDGADLDTVQHIAAIYGDRPFGDGPEAEPEPEPEPLVPAAPVQ